ncbi:MAG: MBL fold metallo-hydrolase [Pygmaiobacter massiliensis]|nr:MBL fold metallo-hydrolase [Pygmaiobacter massiliensis]
MARYEKRQSRRRKSKKAKTAKGIVVLVVLLLVALASGQVPAVWLPVNWLPEGWLPTAGETNSPIAEGTAQIHVIDVGQGDAVLMGQGEDWCLIDAGTPASADSLVAYLQALGISQLDLLIMTHPHADHIGGMPKILQNFEVEKMVLPDFSAMEEPTTSVYERTLEQLDQQPDCEVLTASVGATFPVGDGMVTILYTGLPDADDYNDISVCTLYEAAGVRYLSTGDAESGCEEEMLQLGIDLSADIYKAAHHGSSTSNTAAFLQAVSPGYIAISCGAGNDYGHPHRQVLDLFAQTKAQLFRTDQNGSVVFCLENGAVTVQKAA